MPLSALDSINPAFEHAKQQTLKPFSISQWTKLAFVGLLAGELSTGSCNLRSFPTSPTTPTPAGGVFHGIDPALIGALITVLILSGLVLAAVLMYVSSVF